ncbi:MAG TPA: ATP-binding protein [Ktedonobacterales bacterium]|nr:ATP-binding protein [Ktedonobacterales bacterium]
MSYANKQRRWPFWRRVSLRWRLALALLALLTVILTALGGVILVTQQQALLRGQAGAMRAQAGVATRSVPGGGLLLRGQPPLGPAAGAGAPPTQHGATPTTLAAQANALVRRLASPNLRATVLSPAGMTLAASDSVPIVLPPTVTITSAQLHAALTSSSAAASYLLISANGQRQLVVISPLVEAGSQTVIAALALNTPTAPLDATLATLRLVLIIGVAGALVLAALLVIPVVTVALRPLTAMEQASREIARGALSLRLEAPPSQDEVGRLARAFNEMVAQLDDLIRRQQQFVADASHELRTPLTALRGGLEMLLIGADQGDAEAARRLVRGMYAESLRMQRLVDDLLTLTHIDNQRVALRPSPIALADLLAEVADEAERIARGQRITTNVTPPTLRLVADADHLKQALLNLVSNAIKFTPPSGEVMISAHEGAAHETVALTVRDTGVGIPPELTPHVFDRFVRGEVARARHGRREGSGLGLAIVKGLVEAQGGAVAIESAVGVGTAATITLPASPQSEPSPAATQA